MNRFLLSLLLMITALSTWAVSGVAGSYKIDLTSDPDVVPVGKAKLLVRVKDSAGKPVTGAQVKVFAQMPSMPMGEIEQVANPETEAGLYSVNTSFAMAGGYDVKISVKASAGEGVGTLNLQTGESATATHGFNPVSYWPWALVVGLIAWVLVKVRKSGQKFDPRSLFTRASVIGVGVLIITVVCATYAINHWRRPGAMTPVEAQVMDMAAAPPEGSTPVDLVTVARKPFHSTLTYTGQVVGYNEQDVTARVSGVVQWMPLYVGDRVKKGQLLARLDTTQIDPQIAERRAMVDSAQQGVGVAEADYAQSKAMIHQAEAEHGQYVASVQEAEANVQAAVENRSAMQAQIASAQADLEDANARVTSAEADTKYWDAEILRMNSLLKAGAVSKDEFQKEKAEADKSQAALRQAKQAVLGSRAKVRAAQATARGADAMVTASQRKLASSQNEAHIHHMHVEAANAAAESSRRKIQQAHSGVRQAAASLSGVAVQQNYASLTAGIDGVVTQRLLSPGQLVAAGQSVLKVAQVQPIRVQANVPQSELSRVKVGDTVKIRRNDKDLTPTNARVTSIQPSVDSAARTGIVEAILPNQARTFLPGQFVSVAIEVGSGDAQLTVPLSAVYGPSGNSYVWVAKTENGRTVASRKTVKLGATSGDDVAILEGLEAGERVVTTGGSDLKDGQEVTSVSKEVPTITVSDQGFSPAAITLPAGQPVKLTFIRVSDKTCGTEVTFPDIHVTKPLPLNQPVTIEIPARAAGDLNFSCGMGMLHGKVVIQ